MRPTRLSSGQGVGPLQPISKTVLELQACPSSLIGQDEPEHARYVTRAIEELAKEFVIDWNLDNKSAENDSGDSKRLNDAWRYEPETLLGTGPDCRGKAQS
jgi:hypothetical protein